MVRIAKLDGLIMKHTMSGVDKKAFNYETGQFICHVYATIPESERQTVDDVIQVVQDEQTKSNNPAMCDWKPLCDEADETSLHITLLRGHRAVYYHQIRSLIETLRLECTKLQPFSLCLDDLRIFQNLERNRQFLCLASRSSSNSTDDSSPLAKLKQTLMQSIDQYAIKLTNEDETSDTAAHSSLMFRDVCSTADVMTSDLDSTVKVINELCFPEPDEYPMLLVQVETVQVKIGNHVYTLDLPSKFG